MIKQTSFRLHLPPPLSQIPFFLKGTHHPDEDAHDLLQSLVGRQQDVHEGGNDTVEHGSRPPEDKELCATLDGVGQTKGGDGEGVRGIFPGSEGCETRRTRVCDSDGVEWICHREGDITLAP